jgi:hypothetical protein
MEGREEGEGGQNEGDGGMEGREEGEGKDRIRGGRMEGWRGRIG